MNITESESRPGLCPKTVATAVEANNRSLSSILPGKDTINLIKTRTCPVSVILFKIFSRLINVVKSNKRLQFPTIHTVATRR